MCRGATSSSTADAAGSPAAMSRRSIRARRVYVGPEYYRPLGIPTVVFSVGNYWDRYYRNRDFYRDRDRWRRGPEFYRAAAPRL